jgi:hypothetical protein
LLNVYEIYSGVDLAQNMLDAMRDKGIVCRNIVVYVFILQTNAGPFHICRLCCLCAPA